MQVTKKDLEKSQIELTVELSIEELAPYVKQGAEKISQEVKVDGFRSGKIPYEILKSKIGEITILEEAAHIAVNKTIDKAITENLENKQVVGQPQISITKLAPDNPMEYKIKLAVLPETTLGEYKDLKIKEKKEDVKDSEIAKTVEYLREAQVKEALVEREIKEGDKALVDIDLFLDKVPVEGGQGKGVAIIIGKGYIIPGFDKNLIGAKKGDVREFNLPYPEKHHMANLAGRLVEHKVAVKDVYERELPALDDKFASNFGLKSIDELKNNIRKSLEAEKQEKTTQKAEIEILDKIIEKTKFGDIPDLLIKSESDAMIHELEHSITQQGGKFEDYLGSIKKTKEQLILDLLPDAIKRVKSALIIREVAGKENITVSKNEVEENIEKILKQYKGYEKIEARLKEPGYKAHMENVLTNRKVIEKLREWNIEKQ